MAFVENSRGRNRDLEWVISFVEKLFMPNYSILGKSHMQIFQL